VSSDFGFPVLSVLVLLPAAGALFVACLPRAREELVKGTAVLSSIAAAAVGGWMLVEFQLGDAGFQFVDNKEWVADLGISWHLGVDGISLFLVVMTLVLFPIAMLATDPGHDAKPYYAWLLLLEAGCLGTFLALDLFLFFVMFEIVLVPMYFLIGGWGHGRKVYAALKFFIYTMLGSALMLVGILSLVILTARETGNAVTFDLVTLAESQSLAVNTGRWIFLAFAVAFSVKTPLFPLHTWLPDAHTEAPTAGSVILAGVMLKLGTYGFLRFGLYLFPEASVYFAPLMVTLGVIGILYAAIVATVQKDLKRLVAYSSVAHLGFIVLGTFAFTTLSLQGSVLQMVNHGLSTGALFLLVGMIYERRHTREIAAFGGLQKAAPLMAFVFTIVMLSSIGLPGLNGFVGEFLILVGSFLTREWWAVVGAAGVIFAALYLLWAYQRVFHGPAEGENAEMPDMNRWELLCMLPLLAGIFFLGIYPRPVLERIEPAVDELIEHIEEFSDYRQPDVAEKREPTSDEPDEGAEAEAPG
jgi:NADH-quinone oxidoreductase subunit M